MCAIATLMGKTDIYKQMGFGVLGSAIVLQARCRKKMMQKTVPQQDQMAQSSKWPLWCALFSPSWILCLDLIRMTSSLWLDDFPRLYVYTYIYDYIRTYKHLL
jgi:hypothetical protein